MTVTKLSGSDRRMLYTLLKGAPSDATGVTLLASPCEARLLKLIAAGYLRIHVTDKAIRELSDDDP